MKHSLSLAIPSRADLRFLLGSGLAVAVVVAFVLSLHSF